MSAFFSACLRLVTLLPTLLVRVSHVNSMVHSIFAPIELQNLMCCSPLSRQHTIALQPCLLSTDCNAC